ncbi:MAG: L-aspartate oxidase [Bacteroidales bacterium]|jgi:L-aspartate oxidase|nr:L-aspartate oxidase [Bacteroidales bacterium]MBQ2397172.1 L-aspartate oxidase [Bacteroidales bacterium]MBQ5873064.1 L-aspartate oxidase [Bacteroidales bacterium]MED9961668.1 L-aspartate oxidase [Bacteroidales bacterium]MEE0882576.1 L-aspartate oxidase [Bacteroidales bacterium]
MRFKVDFLVIGSGIAGLSYALKVADYGKVCVLTKSDASECSTKYAQGGIAAVMYDNDSYEKHINDTLIAGAGLCDLESVKITITESTDRIKELIEWGTNFDKKQTGLYDLAKEGGHSEYRILHHRDNTGFEIERALLEKVRSHPNVIIKENQYTIDIITQHHLGQEVNRRRDDIRCFGAYVLDKKTNTIDTYLSKVTMLCTGGNGNVYSTTTSPLIATGDGQAMVHRAKGKLRHMEFIQFHPTSLFNPREKPSFLITEAMRGAGGILKNMSGEPFMDKYDKRGSLAPRDIVARAVNAEMTRRGDEHEYLDCRGISKDEIMRHFPNIYAKCLEIGINITQEMIPIIPAAHYCCGGIEVDQYSRTSIKNLYASGECSCTGLHGANRLASNSLLESLVYSHRAYLDSIKKISETDFCDQVPNWDSEGMVLNEELSLITQSVKEVQQIMTNYVGIVRSDLRLRKAFTRMKLIYEETEELYNKSVLTPQLCELRNLIANSYLIIKMAEQRKESVGLHYSIDYPPQK